VRIGVGGAGGLGAGVVPAVELADGLAVDGAGMELLAGNAVRVTTAVDVTVVS